mmetsp:Transcript_19029/g.61266  ORF Transcript_19029/g.61266 Transcript_19029/m.61266 type:complete len:572 (+) Transcript_19029:721-2436(+)
MTAPRRRGQGGRGEEVEAGQEVRRRLRAGAGGVDDGVEELDDGVLGVDVAEAALGGLAVGDDAEGAEEPRRRRRHPQSDGALNADGLDLAAQELLVHLTHRDGAVEHDGVAELGEVVVGGPFEVRGGVGVVVVGVVFLARVAVFPEYPLALAKDEDRGDEQPPPPRLAGKDPLDYFKVVHEQVRAALPPEDVAERRRAGVARGPVRLLDEVCHHEGLFGLPHGRKEDEGGDDGRHRLELRRRPPAAPLADDDGPQAGELAARAARREPPQVLVGRGAPEVRGDRRRRQVRARNERLVEVEPHAPRDLVEAPVVGELLPVEHPVNDLPDVLPRQAAVALRVEDRHEAIRAFAHDVQERDDPQRVAEDDRPHQGPGGFRRLHDAEEDEHTGEVEAAAADVAREVPRAAGDRAGKAPGFPAPHNHVDRVADRPEVLDEPRRRVRELAAVKVADERVLHDADVLPAAHKEQHGRRRRQVRSAPQHAVNRAHHEQKVREARPKSVNVRRHVLMAQRLSSLRRLRRAVDVVQTNRQQGEGQGGELVGLVVGTVAEDDGFARRRLQGHVGRAALVELA